ncbi:lipoprotein insertase outer membrane protein LolB [Accumulibacter sp.]|uniref:lipoprotein insertase outer membrane protein LolB n=1 Tax=Accumulibacter sp. TaxID=2053492 RepID=UPI0025FFB02F|nr:lipoprotein insertase outer membrane protein LolB [Accumulibacter sp.]MCP5228451.1 outer membrane lipoprotein LolB [Accumulibacter sp.]
MRRLCFALLLFVLTALNACSTVPPPGDTPPPAARDTLQAFSLLGRFSLRQEGESYTGRLDWRHAGDSDQLLLSSPLGQGMAEISSDATGARLTDADGKVRHAASADALLQSVLGYPLPLDKLADWVRGRNPDGGRIVADPLGRPLRLQYEDWRIAYEYDSDDPQALPGRLFVERETGLELRLKIDEWASLSPPDPTSAGNSAHSLQ